MLTVYLLVTLFFMVYMFCRWSKDGIANLAVKIGLFFTSALGVILVCKLFKIIA